MVIPEHRAGIAGCDRHPGRGALRIAASAVAAALAIASSPAMADGKNKEGRNRSANIGPVVPSITSGALNFSKPANVVVASVPATSGGSSPGAMPVAVVTSGAVEQSGGASIKDAGLLVPGGNGKALLAAGKSVEIADPESPELRVIVTAPDNRALDIGRIVSQAKQSGIFAAMARQSGQPRANRAALAANGRVMLISSADRDLRRHVPKDHDSHAHHIDKHSSRSGNSGDSSSVESSQIVNAAAVKSAADLAVARQTDTDKDVTTKSGSTAEANNAKSNSHKSPVCS